MIIPTDTSKTGPYGPVVHEEPLPIYTELHKQATFSPNGLQASAFPSPASASSGSSFSPLSSPQASPASATALVPQIVNSSNNFISVSHYLAAIKSSFTVDPWVQIPVALESDESPDLPRYRNLHIETQHGPISADITLVPRPQRANLWLRSNHGSVEVLLRRSTTVAPPFYLNAFSSHGRVVIYLPRTFCGHIVAKSSHGSTKCSEAVKSARTSVSNIDGVKKYFVGNITTFWNSQDQQGDDIVVQAHHGSIRIFFIDEFPNGSTGRVSSFMSSILS
ncbi:hypothetical protein C8J56DRAFT_965009 [Mycena floridula]|nr:hypothetical protein C8J56DRAFT_965009 [Mycena floridula]